MLALSTGNLPKIKALDTIDNTLSARASRGRRDRRYRAGKRLVLDRSIDTPMGYMGFKNREKIVSIVVNERIYFAALNAGGEKKAAESIPLDDFLNDAGDVNPIFALTQRHENALLIVPDYWFGNSSYTFQSRKKSLADAFIERKLLAQFPQQPEIKYFFDCILHHRQQALQWLYVYYLQAPQFFQVYAKLSTLNLTPRRVTSPAFIWKQTLQQKIPDFGDGGTCFIQLLPNMCNLYFFYEGNFLFSRSIPLTEVQIDSSENFSAIAYELNQSIYLFSQRARAEIDHLYLLSFETESKRQLSAALDREIDDLSHMFNESASGCLANACSEPLEYILSIYLPAQQECLFVSHRELRKELDWKPVQFTGMVIGLVLLLLLGIESIFLHTIASRNTLALLNGGDIVAEEAQQRIRQYNDALEVLLNEAQRRVATEILAKTVKSLPQHVQMQEIFFETETNPHIDFRGVISDQGPEHIKTSLATLVANLNKNLKPPRALVLGDVDFEFDKDKQIYRIKFQIGL